MCAGDTPSNEAEKEYRERMALLDLPPILPDHMAAGALVPYVDNIRKEAVPRQILADDKEIVVATLGKSGKDFHIS